MGFLNPVDVHSMSGFQLATVEDNPVAGILRDGMSDGQYYLIENRANIGFDDDPAIYPGMVIYHIDSRSKNNDVGTWPHPVVKLEEADGNDSLGFQTASSEAGDVWTSTSGISGGFRDQTGNQSTNAMMYQPGDIYNRPDNSSYYSYNRLNGFSPAGNTMSCDAQTLLTTVENQAVSTSDYTVTWEATSNTSYYEIQEGFPTILTSFSDSAEDADSMFDDWYFGGTASRDSGGASTGSYSYTMFGYYNSTFGSTVQSMTKKTPIQITPSTQIDFELMSYLGSSSGYLNCQLSDDGGNTWITLGTYNGYVDPWSSISYDYSYLNAQGISSGTWCLIRFVSNFEYISGWSSFPGYGFAIDEITITGINMAGYSGCNTN